MSVLVLHRNPLAAFPYRQWLNGDAPGLDGHAPYPGDLVVLAARDKIESAGERLPDDTDHDFTHLELFDTLDDDRVPARALALAEKYRITHVVAHHEADVALAARLRERLGLDGAWSADIMPFRDKALMKRLARGAGVEVAPHTVPGTAEQARAFAARHGFPVVLKDRAGYNSIGLSIIADQDELEQRLARAYRDGARDDLLVEAFVPGRMCHVDGLVVDGRTVAAWPSQYQYDLASFGTDPGPRVDLTLDVDDPLTPRLLLLIERTLAALKPEGSRLRTHAFHAEVFHTPDDRLVLCEIAARSGGAKIREVFEVLFGIQLAVQVTRAEAGLPLPALEGAVDERGRLRPRCMSGQVLTMKRPGLVRSLPAAPDEEWVKGFWLFAEEGQVIAPASGSADFLTAAVGSAPTRLACERALRALGARIVTQTQIVPLPGNGYGTPVRPAAPDGRTEAS
ncbi:ATP-grasp domain-containing protein [Streptomyces yokosukanensis]|uniref:ATP-grasp domain-containing protein n=1 Tax=Streptomyces yokosukanensis TaxID=67386 RepID=UPI00099E6CB2|nr:ATP-grasp domain-containing protein [Streptomyces yokosukanensis]